MTLTFLKVKLHNFMSFGDAEVDLNDMGNILVTGRNYCKLDNAYSNGSGKSSIFNAICYALTGETSQGVSNGIENIFAEPNDCWVELSFKANDDVFNIKRIKTPKSDMKIWINGEDKSGKGIRESSKLLATYLPDLTSELISSVIILGQGLPYKFSDNSPAQRKEILEKLTKSDFMIQSIKDKLDTRQSELKDNLKAKELEQVSVASEIKVYNEQLDRTKKELEVISSVGDFDEKIENLENLIAMSDDTLEGFNNDISNYESLIASLQDSKSKIVMSENDKLHENLRGIDASISSYNESRTNASAEIRMLKNEIQQLDSITDICPTCGQKIPDVNKPDTSERKIKLVGLEKDFDALNKSLDELKSKREAMTEDNARSIRLMTEEVNNQISDMTTKLNGVKSNLKRVELEKESYKQELFKCKSFKENKDKLESSLFDIEEKLGKLLIQSESIDSSIKTINSHIDSVQQMITLARREFRGILLSSVIEFIDKKVKQYSLEVFGTTELNFTLDENCIDISYCNKMYENMSGGEKQKIDIIIQLALRDILSQQLGIRSNLLICDEIYDNMDGVSCQKITNLISTLTDISSIFIISHHAQDLEITYDNNLLVEKDENGISTISFV